MSAEHSNRPRRAAVNGLAMGVAVSLTALTAGLAPAVAKPGDDQVAPTTPLIVVPEAPKQEAPQQEAPKEAPQPEAPKQEAPKQQVPVAPVPAPEPAPAPVAEPVPVPAEVPAAPKTRLAPEPTQASEAPAPRSSAPTAVDTPADDPFVQKKPTTPAVPTTASSAPTTVTSAPEPAAAPEEPTASKAPAASRAPDSSSNPAPDAAQPGAAGSASAAEPPSGAEQAPRSGASESSETAKSSRSSEAPAQSATEDQGTTERSPDGTVSIAPAAREIVTEKPQTLAAPQADVAVAKAAKATDEEPAPATLQDVQAIADVVKVSSSRRDDRDEPGLRRDDFDRRDGRDWNRSVKQWDPQWVTYDQYYRPVISNPYRQPVKIIYVYQNAPRVVVINPLAQVVLNVAQYAAYSFTAVVANAVNATINTAANLAVGSFFGGGYFPGFGLPLPPPPPPVLRYDNVPVQVRYSDAVYQPFRVQRIVDVGDDAVYGARKVLLDGVTPAWGTWTQTATGERMFEVNKTQQFPGLDEPAQVPLPGDYQLRLASDEAPASSTGRTVYMVIAAIVLAAMSAGAVLWSVVLGRRRSQG